MRSFLPKIKRTLEEKEDKFEEGFGRYLARIDEGMSWNEDEILQKAFF